MTALDQAPPELLRALRYRQQEWREWKKINKPQLAEKFECTEDHIRTLARRQVEPENDEERIIREACAKADEHYRNATQPPREQLAEEYGVPIRRIKYLDKMLRAEFDVCV